MKLIADTVVLIHALSGEQTRQSPLAGAILAEVELVAIPTAALCSASGVLLGNQRNSWADIARAIENLVSSENVRVDKDAVEAGLATLRAKGDFAEGVIIREGRMLGGKTFVSFVEDLRDIGEDVRLPS